MIQDKCLTLLTERALGQLLWHAQRLALAEDLGINQFAAQNRLVIDHVTFEFGGRRITVAGDSLLGCCPPRIAEGG